MTEPEAMPSRRKLREQERRGGRARDASVPRRRRRRWPWIVGSIVLVLALIAGGGYLWYQNVRSDLAQVTRLDDDVFPGEEERAVDATPDALNILLLGADDTGELGNDINEVTRRSDTILVLHIPADRQSVQVMSIPRDSYVEVPGFGEQKINSALSEGGVSTAVSVIEGIIGDRVDHIGIIGFDGLGKMVDVLGGVTVTNDIGFRPRLLRQNYFPEGELTLENGTQALAFVRERQSFPDGDFQRIRNQQEFIRSVVQKMLDTGALSNPVTLSNLLGEMAPYLALDSGLSNTRLVEIANELAAVPSENMTFFTIPTLGTGTEGGQSVVYLDDDWVELVGQHFAADDLDTFLVRPVEDEVTE